MSFTATKTVGDVATDLKRTFGDESGVQVTDTDIVRWVNEAQIEICSKNQVLVAKADTLSVAAQYDYDISGLKIQSIHSIHYNGVKLRGVSFLNFEDEYLRSDPNRSSSGNPEVWARWGNSLSLYPTPSTSNDTIKIYYYAVPANVGTTADTLSLPDNYYARVVEYCLHKAYEMDENFAASENKINRFDSNLVGMVGDETTPKQDTYSTITVRPEDL